MRKINHLTPRYIWNRLSLMNCERRNPDHPWLTLEMVNILDTWLQPSDIGLEYGSGRSTCWFAQRVGHLTSVEHNTDWFEIVENKLANLEMKVDYNLQEDGITESKDSNYVEVARKMSSSSLDFVLVDGVSRDHCALASLDKLKSGGILIVDNVNWFIPREPMFFSPNSRNLADGYASEVWVQVGKHIKDWRCIWTTNGVSDTAFWVRP